MTLHISIPEDESEDIEVSYGTPPYIPPREENNITPTSGEKEGINPFTPIITPISVDVTSQKSMAVFRQSNKSREFADDAIDETDRQRYIRMGTVMHQVFSEIATADDVLPVLQKMEYDGILYDEDITKDSLIEELRSKFQNEQVRDWFSGRWMLYNECTIISKDGEQRPDRVMTDGKETIVVDYKFGKPHSDYAEQVKSYMALLKQMGMPDVKGYLWYVTLNKIEQV
ncbi:MAG: Dna2/Cas4 domain-containing protein [Prevotella sp.]|nr:Dna2/Cas4 domain-containing protein [Prevotella sp.]